MTRTIILGLAALAVAAPLAAQSNPEPKPESVVEIRRIEDKNGPTADIPAEVRAKVINCEGRKFEADATSGEGKDKKRNRIVLCGNKGATDAEVAIMLESAVDKLEANTTLPAENRDKIVAQLKAKIAELKAN